VQRYKTCRTYGVPLPRKSNEGRSKVGVEEKLFVLGKELDYLIRLVGGR
jgi:hypothetical protein